MDERYVEKPRPVELKWSCGFAPTPGVEDCLDPATWHGMGFAGSDVHEMASCDAHKPLMEAAADYVHEMDSPCGLAGSLFKWPENFCFIPWDEEALTAAASLPIREEAHA